MRFTPKGRSTVDALDAPVRDLHVRQLGRLTRAELKSLNTLLEKARATSDSEETV